MNVPSLLLLGETSPPWGAARDRDRGGGLPNATVRPWLGRDTQSI